MFDLVIRGDKVVTPQGMGAYDLAIAGERIAAVAAPNTIPDSAAERTIDASGKFVIPGGIDTHVHCKWPVVSATGDPTFTEPPSVVSRAALFGGTTTMLDFAAWTHGMSIADAIRKRDQDWVDQCHCDYSYHVLIEGELPLELPGQIADAIEDGYPTVKIFTTNVRPLRKGRKIHHGDIWEVFKVLAKHRGLCALHCEDDEIVMHMYAKLLREGRVSFEHMAEVHNSLSEDLSFRRIIKLAESVPGTALFMMHVSAATGVAAIAEARQRGVPIYGETLHQYLLYNSDDYRRPNGQIYHTYPSLKSPADQAALWEGMKTGAINSIATDELCCNLSMKTKGSRIDDTTGGNSAVEPRVALMFTELVGKRGHTVEEFVDLVSTNAAKIMGLYPRKGALAAGADADITILDPAAKRRLTASELHETDYTPWEGWEVDVWPTMTLMRGKIVVEGGKFHGSLSDGRYLRRSISEEIVSGAALS